MSSFTHINEENQPGMVDVSAKAVTARSAHARATVILPEAVMRHLVDGEIKTKKGPVFQTAIIAGTMAAKKTGELIPLCHPIGLEDCKVHIAAPTHNEVIIDCHTAVSHKTGVEMEALTGACVAALTIYDMCKALSHGIVIRDVRLMEKRGGMSDYSE
ncbi:MAG: cyclic pyranopterin monophosphate synthase MoaC [Candidatus Hydrogenedentes bacterium]|nr:cyclic pyranopterin monophosphate synthase MoaC [Candidatus Hydrogenedentota bacterium]MBI3119574.1 cyclic pyranopterin monophosphate synthase MoaC [Candidatus Hydrogenedentota bacterium]